MYDGAISLNTAAAAVAEQAAAAEQDAVQFWHHPHEKHVNGLGHKSAHHSARSPLGGTSIPQRKVRTDATADAVYRHNSIVWL